MKIFFIGFNKTGTTTYHFVFNNFNSTHNTNWSKISNNSNSNQFLNYFNRYDCYTDGELSNYTRLHEGFPNALFILNTRKLYDWIYSRIKHIYRCYPIKSTGFMAKEWHKIENKTDLIIKWIRTRNNYYKKCIEYFHDNPNFIILDIDDSNLEKRLTLFTGITIKNIVKKNKRNILKFKTKEYFHEIILSAFAELNIEEKDYNSTGIIPYI